MTPGHLLDPPNSGRRVERELMGAREPALLVEVLDCHLRATVVCIRAEGGSVNEFLGDGIMALFGAPAPLADQAHGAVRCALAMGRALYAFNANTVPGKQWPVAVHAPVSGVAKEATA